MNYNNELLIKSLPLYRTKQQVIYKRNQVPKLDIFIRVICLNPGKSKIHSEFKSEKTAHATSVLLLFSILWLEYNVHH